MDQTRSSLASRSKLKLLRLGVGEETFRTSERVKFLPDIQPLYVCIYLMSRDSHCASPGFSKLLKRAEVDILGFEGLWSLFKLLTTDLVA